MEAAQVDQMVRSFGLFQQIISSYVLHNGSQKFQKNKHFFIASDVFIIPNSVNGSNQEATFDPCDHRIL